MPVVAKQHDADFVLVHVERNAVDATGEFDQLLEAHAGEAGHLGDAGGDTGDRANLVWPQLRGECFSRLAYSGEHVIEDAWQALGFHVHALFAMGFASSGLVFSVRSSATSLSSDAR